MLMSGRPGGWVALRRGRCAGSRVRQGRGGLFGLRKGPFFLQASCTIRYETARSWGRLNFHCLNEEIPKFHMVSMEFYRPSSGSPTSKKFGSLQIPGLKFQIEAPGLTILENIPH